MKIAVGIIGILLGLLVLLQSCTVATGGHLVDNKALGEAGSIGVFVGFLCFVGGAFAFGLPLVSVFVFALAGLLAFMVSGDFPDMMVWGFVSVGLAGLSAWAWRSGRTKAANATSQRAQP
ncbi:MAG: hypothetical protein KF723_04060 [Rhizobiaceae bacterium]|nr:hypothetical protein [Rhizobiaceae bacterium]